MTFAENKIFKFKKELSLNLKQNESVRMDSKALKVG